MASPLNAALCALIATGFWTLLGYAIGRRLLPSAPVLGAAPIIGWAVYSVAALPIHFAIGFSPVTVLSLGALCVCLAGLSLVARAPKGKVEHTVRIPIWALAAAGLLALVPAAAVLPKFVGDAVQFADPIFDHSKIAIIDAMTRQGLPPVNPVFGEFGAPGRLAYYYLWHFSAAELAMLLGASGWEADIGLTWFTAFASLTLMMGLAIWLGKRATAAIWVVVLAAAASLWLTLDWITDSVDLRPFLWPPAGMAGWLFQASWVPQHVMAASCVVTAMFLVTRYAETRSPALLLTLVMVVAAGFESSSFVGGVTFAIAAFVAAPILFARTAPARRLHLAVGLAVAVLFVAVLATPFALDQLAAVRLRGDGSPIVIDPYRVIGEILPPLPRRLLDIPAYWLILLPIELPATYFAGVMALAVALRSALPPPEKLAVASFACLAGAGLVVSWLLVSTLSGNNDLGLRAIIPAEIILIVGAAAGLTFAPRRLVIGAAALAGLVLSLPDTVKMIHDNWLGQPRPDGNAFAQAPQMWDAVRRYAAPTARVANNPLFVGNVTPWPVNISWALLANRSSCFAGRELAVALAPLSPQRRETINAQFIRVFGGEGTAEDVRDMANRYGCEIVVVAAQDKAWDRDPFTASSDYHLAESSSGRWRIYVRTK